ncbi:MAG: YfiR family protein [Bryobacteraceae bacterium]
MGSTPVGLAAGEIGEYEVKAAFLYNFARFVEWPATAFSGPRDPIVICILGDNPFGDSLSDAIRGKELAGRSFAVRRISELPLKSRCQILFVTSAGMKLLRPAAGTLKSAPILTVGETPGFGYEGGVINFKLEDGRIRFEINVEAAEQAHLNISSKLLSLAQIVKSRRKP